MIDPREQVEDCRKAFFATGNPLYVWGALQALFRPAGTDPMAEYAEPPEARVTGEPLPSWVADYLWQVARDLGDLAAGRNPAERPSQAATRQNPEALHKWLRTEVEWPKGSAPGHVALWHALGCKFNHTLNPFVEFRQDIRARDADFAFRAENGRQIAPAPDAGPFEQAAYDRQATGDDGKPVRRAPAKRAMERVGAKHPTQWKRDLRPRAKRLRGDDS